MLPRGKAKDGASPRKVTPPPPSPSYMNNDQFAAYLANLRSNRVNRPGGARPQPTTSRRDSSRLSIGGQSSISLQPASETSSLHQRTLSDLPSPSRQSLSGSVRSRYSASYGKDYVPELPAQPLKPSDVVPTATYMERGHRWMEKEEAVSLRQAMEDMGLKDEDRDGKPKEDEDDEERRIYNAALEEAAELVWRHQNPTKEPEPGTPYRYTPHLRKNSYAHARTASAGLYGSPVAPTGLARDQGARSVSASSTESEGVPGSTRSRTPLSSPQRPSGTHRSRRESLESTRRTSTDSKASKPYSGISAGSLPKKGARRRTSLKRDISGEIEKPFSGDHIWEEPEGQAQEKKEASEADGVVQPLRIKPKNPLNRVQFASEAPPTVGTSPVPPPKAASSPDIQRSAPSKSHDPQYTTNSRPGPSPEPEPEPVARKHGVEIRSDDIRQATSMRLKERSPKLPIPSAVSDNPGRPIVSFDKNWRPPEEATDEKPEEPRFGGGGRASPFVRRGLRREQQQQQQQQQEEQHRQQQQQQQQHQQKQEGKQQRPPQEKGIPVIAVSEDPASAFASAPPAPPPRSGPAGPPAIQVDAPAIPTISVPEPVPPIPAIVTPDDQGEGSPSVTAGVAAGGGAGAPGSRPLPTPQPGAPRGHLPARPRSHWSPAPAPFGSRATARCHECSRAIEGRFVSLAGSPERFHPQCFTCYSCGTSLEALEISPEPEEHRAARLERIARRAAGEALPETAGQTAAEDGDARLRFYCHLDWHELFAPRCRHCKTPILGEHVVALGAHWHHGHFFCAECGDPFGRGATHIEKDGYAWCVGCQTKRTERRAPKCRRCRLAVVGQYVRALGGEWHDECFRCAACGGAFDDGQIFPMEGRGAPGETVVLCTPCRERELKA